MAGAVAARRLLIHLRHKLCLLQLRLAVGQLRVQFFASVAPVLSAVSASIWSVSGAWAFNSSALAALYRLS